MALPSVKFEDLRWHKKNGSVKILQTALIKNGHKIPDGATGYWGPQTQSALDSYRRKIGLKGDDAKGRIGTWSINKLKKGAYKFTVKFAAAAPASGSGSRVQGPVLLSNGKYGPKGYAYGTRNSGYAAGYHTGQDYPASTGTRLVAVRSGRVTFFWGGAYGNVARLQADNGRDYWYCHMSRNGKGGSVKAGTVIGYVGTTGNSTGPHCHFEDRPRGGGYGRVRRPKW